MENGVDSITWSYIINLKYIPIIWYESILHESSLVEFSLNLLHCFYQIQNRIFAQRFYINCNSHIDSDNSNLITQITGICRKGGKKRWGYDLMLWCYTFKLAYWNSIKETKKCVKAVHINYICLACLQKKNKKIYIFTKCIYQMRGNPVICLTLTKFVIQDSGSGPTCPLRSTRFQSAPWHAFKKNDFLKKHASK